MTAVYACLSNCSYSVTLHTATIRLQYTLGLTNFNVHVLLQYRVVRRLIKSDPGAAKHIAEAEGILSHPLVFSAPWVPLKYLAESDILPYALLTMTTFGSMFASLTGGHRLTSTRAALYVCIVLLHLHMHKMVSCNRERNPAVCAADNENVRQHVCQLDRWAPSDQCSSCCNNE
jgi:hypothetical protein